MCFSYNKRTLSPILSYNTTIFGWSPYVRVEKTPARPRFEIWIEPGSETGYILEIPRWFSKRRRIVSNHVTSFFLTEYALTVFLGEPSSVWNRFPTGRRFIIALKFKITAQYRFTTRINDADDVRRVGSTFNLPAALLFSR